jgi:hypothetical protein
VLSSEAYRLLGVGSQAFRWQLRSREYRLKHRVGTTGHTHRYSFVPAQLFHFFALTLPWRYQGLIPVPESAIREAQDRDEIEDRLFVMWATERNARCLHRLLRVARVPKAERVTLRAKYEQLYRMRLDLQRIIIDQVHIPDWRRPRRSRYGGDGLRHTDVNSSTSTQASVPTADELPSDLPHIEPRNRHSAPMLPDEQRAYWREAQRRSRKRRRRVESTDKPDDAGTVG